MKLCRAILIILIAGFVSCNTSPGIKKTDPLESGRGFIEASLDGNYDKAEKYLLADSTNMEYFSGLKSFNQKQEEKIRQGYRDANIIIDSVKQLSDSLALIYYSNTFKMKPSTLKMVKRKSEWLVDFKYSFIDR